MPRDRFSLDSSFNPRARAGRDLREVAQYLLTCVSIHAPARGATEVVSLRESMIMFQSTRPRGARLEDRRPPMSEEEFQSTRPRGARQGIRAGLSRHPSFNPRARAGRDMLGGSASSIEEVSIHAPARGATDLTRFPFELFRFQSTRPRGARRETIPADPELLKVSIHAPARGATPSPVGSCRGTEFQSTRPRGARRSRFMGSRSSSRFQSTRPRGARLGASPRSYPGGVSIHAPARGATPAQTTHGRGCRVSIHAPARGATYYEAVRDCTPEFQSTRPRGARLA